MIKFTISQQYKFLGQVMVYYVINIGALNFNSINTLPP